LISQALNGGVLKEPTQDQDASGVGLRDALILLKKRRPAKLSKSLAESAQPATPKLDVETRADDVDRVSMRMRAVRVERQVFKPSRHCGANLALDPEPPDEPSVGAATVD
jgi:hypothetical protein